MVCRRAVERDLANTDFKMIRLIIIYQTLKVRTYPNASVLWDRAGNRATGTEKGKGYFVVVARNIW